MSECGQDFSRAGCSGPDGSGGRFCPPAPGFAGVFSLGGELITHSGFPKPVTCQVLAKPVLVGWPLPSGREGVDSCLLLEQKRGVF